MNDRIRHAISRVPAGPSLLELWRELRMVRGGLSGASRGLGLPLNGQVARMKTVRALLNDFSPDAIIETGTFLGDSARFFSGNLIPVYTIELKRLFYFVAKWRLRFVPELTLIRGSSTVVLGELAMRPIFRPFLYLDAHWWNHLPLQAEVAAIIARWQDSIILVDDVQVASDPGYGFDSYGGVPLSLDLLDLPVSAVCAFPATPSSEETGGKRGALYIASGRSAIQALHGLAENGSVTLVASRAKKRNGTEPLV